MKIVAISDTHGQHDKLKLPIGDVLIHAGDMTMRGTKEQVKDFFDWLEKQNFQHKIVIAGNHDFYFETELPEKIKSVIPSGVIYLNDSGVKIDTINFWGSPVTPWFFDWAFNRQRGRDIRKHWDLMPPNTDVLITHGPVLGILDKTLGGDHAGCKDLLNRVEKVNPKIHICGHIHEGYGMLRKLGTKFINASVLNGGYELVNEPIVFEIP